MCDDKEKHRKKRIAELATDHGTPDKLEDSVLVIPRRYAEDTPLPFNLDEIDSPAQSGLVLEERDGELDPEDEEVLESVIKSSLAEEGPDTDSDDEHVMGERDYRLLGEDVYERMLRECATPEDQREFLSDEFGEIIDVTQVFEFRKRYIQTYDLTPADMKKVMNEVDKWIYRTSAEEFERGGLIRVIERKRRETINRSSGDDPLSVAVEEAYLTAEKCIASMKLSPAQKKGLTRNMHSCFEKIKEYAKDKRFMVDGDDAYDFCEDYIADMGLEDFQERELIRRVHSWLDDKGSSRYHKDSMIDMIEEHAKYV